MMHQAAYKYCKPEASIKFDTYHVDGRTIVIATVPPSERKPVCAINEVGEGRAYIRISRHLARTAVRARYNDDLFGQRPTVASGHAF